jgi:CRISPR/Cas system-associated endonuclease Cas1
METTQMIGAGTRKISQGTMADDKEEKELEGTHDLREDATAMGLLIVLKTIEIACGRLMGHHAMRRKCARRSLRRLQLRAISGLFLY